MIHEWHIWIEYADAPKVKPIIIHLKRPGFSKDYDVDFSGNNLSTLLLRMKQWILASEDAGQSTQPTS